MHEKTHVKKVVLAVILLGVIGGAGFFIWMKKVRSTSSAFVAGQILFMNDSSDTISVEYKVNGANEDMVIQPNTKSICGSDGFVRIFTANKSGSYEVSYPVDQKQRTLELSQIVNIARKGKAEEEVFTEKGMIGDIKVTYEELLE